MVGFVIWIVGLVLDYQSRTGNMAYPCTNRKTADSYYLNRSYQLDRIAVLLFLRQGTNAAMAGYWSSKILATSESNIYMNIILNMGETAKVNSNSPKISLLQEVDLSHY